MPVRALMFDVDGVVVHHPPGRAWDSDLKADLGLDPEDLDREFFALHFSDIVLGRADLVDRLSLVLPALGDVSPHQLIDYWFAHDAVLDSQLLLDLSRARALGFAVELATVQEHHRALYMWQTLGLREHFDTIHYAAELGAVKTDPRFYRQIELRTGRLSADHCLIDDRSENIQTALSVGWRAFLWTARSDLGEVLRHVAS